MFVKLAPDLTDEALEQARRRLSSAGAAGLIATNTTLARDGLDPREAARAAEAGRAVRCSADRPGPAGGALPGRSGPTCR